MTEFQFTTEELNSEIWKPIAKYEGLYEVSDLGRIRSLQWHGKPRLKVLSPSPNSKGYSVVSLYKNRRPKAHTVHVLVAKAFLRPARPEQNQVNHKDLDKQNNRISNLEWNTAKEDGEHRARMGAAASGSRHGAYTQPHRRPRGDRHGMRIKSLMKQLKCQ